MSAIVIPASKLAHIQNGQLPGPVGYLGCVFLSVQNAVEALDLLQQTASRLSTYLDVTSFENTEDITSVLDAGASTVIVNKSQLQSLDVNNLDQDRVALLITGIKKDDIITALGDKSVGIFTSNVTDVDFVEAWLNEYGEEHPPVYVSFANPTEEHAVKVSKLGGIPVISADLLSVEPSPLESAINLAKVLMAGAKTDRPDGLFTTLVTDERGIALGLVYSSEKSVEESIKLGRGVYQSRKRGLWYKGDSSGDIQELVRVSMDCDRDCLLFVVRQQGRGKLVFICPQNPCSPSRILPSGDINVFRQLHRTLQAAKDFAV